MRHTTLEHRPSHALGTGWRVIVTLARVELRPHKAEVGQALEPGQVHEAGVREKGAGRQVEGEEEVELPDVREARVRDPAAPHQGKVCDAPAAFQFQYFALAQHTAPKYRPSADLDRWWHVIEGADLLEPAG